MTELVLKIARGLYKLFNCWYINIDCLLVIYYIILAPALSHNLKL